MNLLWNLIFAFLVFLLSAVVLAVVLASLKPIFCDFPWRRRARLCYLHAKRRWKRAKRWWKKDWNTKFTDIDTNLEKKWKFIVERWLRIIISTFVLLGFVITFYFLVRCVFGLDLLDYLPDNSRTWFVFVTRPLLVAFVAFVAFVVVILFRKRIAIAGLVSLIAFLWTILWFILSWYVICASLLLLVALVVVILFRKQIFCDFPRYIVRAKKNDTLLGFALSVLIALGGFIITAIVVTWQFNAQSQILRTQYQAEHYKNAIDHLGSEKQAVVLGGVHALHKLAVDNPKDYSQPVFEILCSFIREETRKTDYKTSVLVEINSSEKKANDSSEETQKNSSGSSKQATSLIVIQTIVDKLFRYENPDESVYRDHKKKQCYQADLAGVILPEVNLNNANLQEANLFRANLQGAGLSDANLQKANFENANLQRAVLNKADLQGAMLIGADLQEAWLWNANLREAKLSDAKLQGANLNGANLQEADLREANLQGADLWGANLHKAYLKDAKLAEANLSGANLQEADLIGVNLQGADLRDAKLQGANLWGANLQKANLWNADLQEAWLINVNLQGAVQSHANLQKAVLENANLQGADLFGANLQGARLWGADLQGARLWDADIREVKDADFTGAIGVEQGEDGEWRTLSLTDD